MRSVKTSSSCFAAQQIAKLIPGAQVKGSVITLARHCFKRGLLRVVKSNQEATWR